MIPTSKLREAKKVVAAYKAHAEKIKKALSGNSGTAPRTSPPTWSVSWRARARVYGCESSATSVLTYAGLAPTDFVKGAEDGLMVEVSPEQINKAEADVIFYTSYGSKEKSRESKVTGGPLWQNMSAVKNGQTHRVDDETSLMGIGYTAADKILDGVQERLAKK
ncbi:ABC transporter substrate-binding protein [Streptomyces halobius]|uniref:ABC transporter substrate-binding protein n=1 Tax=Streptomyces halobius TaxID=2879846 RepID=A0ABY4M9Z0_9ACTN|nr:ABC transporter substrate-binding protein [Streptomyces halobius]UQA93599.1 ABC transporter substrate-binding protein [Streptomyces halobius]